MVYLPRTICNHDLYNVLLCYLLVDHNLWSTLHAIIVSVFFLKLNLSTPMYFTGRPYFMVYPPHVHKILPHFINIRT